MVSIKLREDISIRAILLTLSAFTNNEQLDMKNSFVILLLFTLVDFGNLFAQDPHRFDQEIKKFSDLTFSAGEELAIFTGSSSIRFWQDLTTDCSEIRAINTGFGGSQMSDLLYFLNEAVLRFQPKKVYIYEGDNDIWAQKSPAIILETAKQITTKIWAMDAKIEIHFISAKPSPSRWKYKKQYEAFNALLMEYCESNAQLYFVDVWNPMLNEKGRPQPHIFILDSLHMNRKGYLLWKEAICGNSK